jgi:hypothetical protein
VRAGVKAIALVLLKAGADLQAKNAQGRLALEIAETGSNTKMVEFLRQWAPQPAADAPAMLSGQEAGSPVSIPCSPAGSIPSPMQTPTNEQGATVWQSNSPKALCYCGNDKAEGICLPVEFGGVSLYQGRKFMDLPSDSVDVTIQDPVAG